MIGVGVMLSALLAYVIMKAHCQTS